MRKWLKIFDIRTQSDLREYFVLTAVLGAGTFLTIAFFSLSFYYQMKSHQKNLDLRSLRVHEHIQQTLDLHNLGLKYIERRVRNSQAVNSQNLLPMVGEFLEDSQFEAVDIVNVDWTRDRENPQLTLIASDARKKDEKGLIYENFLKRINVYKIPLYNSGKAHSIIFNPGANKNWYVGQIRYVEGRKTELILGWIPIESLFPPMVYKDRPLSIMLTNYLYPTMPVVKIEYSRKGLEVAKFQPSDGLARHSFSTTTHKLLDEDHHSSNVTVNYIYGDADSYGWSWIVLIAGLSISILVSLLLFNLINRNIEVQRLVEEKTQDVIKASHEAMKANEVKTRFLANISHEIRTPLNIILGMAELLAETKLSGDQKKYVETFKKSGVHLLDLINDVIDMIRLEGDEGVFEDKDFSVAEVVQEVSSYCCVTAQGKGIEFSYYLDPTVPALVSGDQRRLKQILLNLINNSIKFTDAGFVKLSVGAVFGKDQKAQFKFTVEDSGIGISESDQKKIFNAFTQLDPSSTRNKGGVGLGLSIVKTILNKIGGNIYIESRVELGSRFVVTVPYEVVAEESWLDMSTQPFAEFFQGKHISVLSKESYDLRMICDMFGRLQCPVDCFSSEFRFLKTTKKTQSFNEIYIVDYESIHKNKAEFLKEIEKITHPRSCVVMLLPVVHEKSDLEGLQKLPNLKIAYKPMSFGTLLSTMANVVPLSDKGGKIEDAKEILGKDAKLLIVEDDIENRQLLKAYLNDIGVETYYAASGNEALQLYKKVHPHLIITDIQMPEMDGFKLTSLMREYEKEYGIKSSIIFALSADALPEHKELAKEVGIDKYLTKPISKATFIRSLVEAERLYRAMDGKNSPLQQAH